MGYLYQFRFALLAALRRVRAGEDFLLQIETLDDVVFDQSTEPLDLLQTKHHVSEAANLTDASPDLWKTFRVWLEGLAADTPSCLYLITTSAASADSATCSLRAEGRDVQRAAERLRATAQSSSNKTNQAAYQAFLNLEPEAQVHFLDRVTIFDGAPNIVDLDAQLRQEVRWAVTREHVEPFLTRIEGWWMRRAVRQLVNTQGEPILSEEFESQMDELREQFKRDALPIDGDILATEVDESAYQDMVFVRQLHLVDVGPQRVLAAIREFFRAFEQRSRWVREDLLLVGELENYERKLVEEWQLVFARVKDELGSSAAEEAKQRAAREVYKWVEETVIAIRPQVTEPFVTRGSYQMLSNALRVGWHPEFTERLRHLLEDEKAAL